MTLGTIGIILVAIAAMRYLIKENDNLGYAIILFGFILTVGYCIFNFISYFYIFLIFLAVYYYSKLMQTLNKTIIGYRLFL